MFPYLPGWSHTAHVHYRSLLIASLLSAHSKLRYQNVPSLGACRAPSVCRPVAVTVTSRVGHRNVRPAIHCPSSHQVIFCRLPWSRSLADQNSSLASIYMHNCLYICCIRCAAPELPYRITRPECLRVCFMYRRISEVTRFINQSISYCSLIIMALLQYIV